MPRVQTGRYYALEVNGNFYVLFDDGSIYKVTLPTAVLKDAWLLGGEYATQIAATNLVDVILVGYYTDLWTSQDSADSFDQIAGMALLNTVKPAVDYSDPDLVWVYEGVELAHDATEKAALWKALADGAYTPSDILAGWTNYKADIGDIVGWCSQDAGVNWNHYLLAYVGQLVPTQIRNALTGVSLASPQTKWDYSQEGNGFDGTFLPDASYSDEATWMGGSSYHADANHPLGIITAANPTDGPNFAILESWRDDVTVSPSHYYLFRSFVNNAAFWNALYDSAFFYFWPGGGGIGVVSAHDGDSAYFLTALTYRDNHTQIKDLGSLEVQESPISPLAFQNTNPSVYTILTFYTNFIHKMDKSGTASYNQIAFAPTGLVRYGAVIPGAPDVIYLAVLQSVAGTYEVYAYTYSTNTAVLKSDPFTGYQYPMDFVVTRLGTLVTVWTDFTDYLYVWRSTDGADNWTLIDLSAYVDVSGGNDMKIGVDANNVLGLAQRNGHFIYSLDDGASWNDAGLILDASLVPIDMGGA